MARLKKYCKRILIKRAFSIWSFPSVRVRRSCKTADGLSDVVIVIKFRAEKFESELGKLLIEVIA